MPEPGRLSNLERMQRSQPGDAIPLAVRMAPRHPPPVPRIPARWLFVATMAVGTAIAAGSGLPLGFAAATGTAFDSRWTEAVQAHGRLQLEAWAVPILAALAFEFLPRLNQRPWLPAWPRLLTLGLLFSGALAQALALFARAQWLMLPGTGAFLAGALLFTVLVVHLRPREGPLRQPQAFYLPIASLWLLAAAAASVVSELRTEAQIVPLADSRLVVELLIRGFLLHGVVGIGLRAFPGHLDLPVVTRRFQVVIVLGLSCSTASWALGSDAVGLPGSESLRRLGDGGLAATILVATLAMHILRPPRILRGLPRYRLLVPLAWLGLVIYAWVLAAIAVRTDAATLTVYEQGAIRHVFLLGFLAPVIFAMAHIVLARFAVSRIPSEPLLTAAAILAWVAWPFRSLPMLWEAAPGAAGEWSMGIAGSLAILAFVLALAVFARVTVQLTLPAHPGPAPR